MDTPPEGTTPETPPEVAAQEPNGAAPRGGKTLADLSDPERDGELSLVERTYVDFSAGRLNTHDALLNLLAFASGCDGDAYADEQGN